MAHVIPAEARTVYGALCESAQRHPGRDFLSILPETAAHYAIEARDYSYAQTLAEIGTLRNRYSYAGMGVGHRVGLMLDNRPAFFFHWLALNALGVSVVPGYVAFCAHLPLTSTEKIQRARLKELAQTLFDTSGCIDLRPFKRRANVE